MVETREKDVETGNMKYGNPFLTSYVWDTESASNLLSGDSAAGADIAAKASSKFSFICDLSCS